MTPDDDESISLVSAFSTTTLCDATLLGEGITVTVATPPAIGGVVALCNGTNTAYALEVAFDAGSGTAQFSGTAGSVAGNSFIVDAIDNGGSYDITLTGDPVCPSDQIIGDHQCECTTFAGNTALDSVLICPNEAIDGTHLNDHFLDADDGLRFILYSGSSANPIDLIDVQTSPTFEYHPGLVPGQVYFISAVAGNLVNGEIDFSDPCLDISPGTPVRVRFNPQFSPGPDLLVCRGSSYTAEFSVAGNPDFSLDYSIAGTAVQWESAQSSGQLNGLVNTTTEIQFTQLSDAYCTIPLDETITIEVPPVLTVDLVPIPENCFQSCDGIAVAEVRGDVGEGHTFAWFDEAGSLINSGWNLSSIYNQCPGSYTLEVADAHGCLVQRDFSIRAAQEMFAYTDSTQDPLCADRSDGWIWTSGSGGNTGAPYTFEMDNGLANRTGAFSQLRAGSYVVTVTDHKGCSKLTTATLNNPAPVVLTYEHDPIVCPGAASAVELLGSGGTGQLTYSVGGVDLLANDTNLRIFSDTSFTMRAVDENGCRSTLLTGFIDVHPDFVSEGRSVPEAVCDGAEITALVNNEGGLSPFSYEWSTGQSDVSGISTFIKLNQVLMVTVTDACDRDTVLNMTPIVRSRPEAVWTWDTIPGCEFIELIIGNQTELIGTEQCTWSSSASEHKLWTGCQDTVLFFSRAEDFAVELSVLSDGGCSDTLTHKGLATRFSTLPTADFSYPDIDYTILSPPIQLTNLSEDAVAYNWLSDDVFFSEEIDPMIEYNDDQATTHAICLEAISKDGCVDSICQYVWIEGAFSLYVPTAFRPDGNGLNDFFFPVTLGFESFEILVYDRWGDKIFHGTKDQPMWDGYYKGLLAKADVYTWKFVGESPYTDEVIRRTGRVTVVR